MKPFVLLAVGLLSASVSTADGPIAARAVGIQVNAPLDPDAFETPPLPGTEGVTVVLLLSQEGQGPEPNGHFMVSIDNHAS